MSLSSMEQQLISYLLIVIWIAVEVVLIIRGNAKGKSYLRRPPPVDGVPLDKHIYVRNDWLKGQNSPLKQAYRQQQTDPELEQLRQQARQRGWIALLWLVGFPVLVVEIAALLIATGTVRPQ